MSHKHYSPFLVMIGLDRWYIIDHLVLFHFARVFATLFAIRASFGLWLVGSTDAARG